MTNQSQAKKKPVNFTLRILMAIVFGALFGLLLNYLPSNELVDHYITGGVLYLGGKVFITILKMLVVPIVFISLICGVCTIAETNRLGWIGLKTLSIYLLTTMIAISLGLFFANFFGVGSGNDLLSTTTVNIKAPPAFTDTVLNMFPSNPFQALVESNMLQIIFFALFFGTAINQAGKDGKIVGSMAQSLNHVVMHMITMVMTVAHYGVFCLVANMFAKLGFSLIAQLASYFACVIFVLLVHVTLTNTILLKLFANLNPIIFFRKMYTAMMFAFSTSSSNASIPIVLGSVEHKLGVRNSIASFVIPLGATINMDGTAIMQGIATVFIANSYNIDLTLTSYLIVVATATLASIGTAGVPSVGLITLTMVLQQVGLPVEGIALIIGIDRLLDMVRTAVNVTGDAAVSCLIAKTENAIDQKRFNDMSLTIADEVHEERHA